MIRLRCVIKRLELRPLDHDPTIRMRSARLNHSRCNSWTSDTCSDVIRWASSPRDPRSVFQRTVDPTPCVSPCHMHLKNRVELSPTREKLKKRYWFIRCDALED